MFLGRDHRDSFVAMGWLRVMGIEPVKAVRSDSHFLSLPDVKDVEVNQRLRLPVGAEGARSPSSDSGIRHEQRTSRPELSLLS